MRVILAGLFVFGGLLVAVALLGETGLSTLGPTLAAVAIVSLMFCLLGLAVWLFNPRGTGFLPGTTLEQQIEALETAGLLTDQEFHATRAFGVAEFEDEGLHYYLELLDGRVLFLSGQYLYDFEPIDDDPEINQARKFPNSQFRIRRHREAGYVVHVVCHGQVLEPEVIAPPFSSRDLRDIPPDGTIIQDLTYDHLKAIRLQNSAHSVA